MEKLLVGVLSACVAGGLIGFILLMLDPSSNVGHVWVNLSLIQLIIYPSIVVHEFAHAVVGRLCGLTVLRIWIGRGKTFYRIRILGFDTEFKIIPADGLTFLTHGFKQRLRFRYFIAVLAGPLANAIILVVAWKYVSWRNFNMETSVQLLPFIVFAQAAILIVNLLPYRIQTAIGKLCTDGLSLIQLLVFRSPDILNSRLKIPFTNGGTQTQSSNM